MFTTDKFKTKTVVNPLALQAQGSLTEVLIGEVVPSTSDSTDDQTWNTSPQDGSVKLSNIEYEENMDWVKISNPPMVIMATSIGILVPFTE